MQSERPHGEIFPRDPKKTYGLMALVEGTSPAVGKEPETTVFTYPDAVVRFTVCAMVVFLFILALSLIADAPLEEMANPDLTPNPAKAPWYFLGLQELVHYDALIGGIVIPALMISGLALWPYLDRNPSRLAHQRPVSIILFSILVLVTIVLTITGTYFRGPEWSFVTPW